MPPCMLMTVAHFLYTRFYTLKMKEGQEGIYMFITINHIEDYCPVPNYLPNMTLKLKKDFENPYDDEAIAVYKNNCKIGYVANSVSSVCRGTVSAGRLYDRFDKEIDCIIRFVSTEYGFLIAQINNEEQELETVK